MYDTHPQRTGDVRALRGKRKVNAVGRSVRQWAIRTIEEWRGGELLNPASAGDFFADASETWLPDIVLCDVSALSADHLLPGDGATASTAFPSPVYRLSCFLGFAVPSNALAELHGNPAR